MKSYLEIKSFGEIEEAAFTMLGASTKKGDESKIGLYGSGNKYAIAAMLRNNIDFRVFSGEDEIRFSTLNKSFRSKDFEVITVNGKETSLTTDMGGKDWDSAFAPLREIYSNALDEDSEAKIKTIEDFIPEKGFTKFFIEMTEEVKHFYKNMHLYFCNANPKVVYSNSIGSIYENTDNGSVRIFRKGILAHLDKDKKALFHYNLNDIEINESRVVKSTGSVNVYVAQILKTCTNKNIVEQVLIRLKGANTGFLEHDLYWETFREFSNEWNEVLMGKKLAPIEYEEMFSDAELRGAYMLPVALLRALKTQFPELQILGLGTKENVFSVSDKPSEILVNKVLDVLSMLNKTRYKYRLNNPKIEYVKFSSQYTLGMANEGTIYLSTKLDSEDISKISKIIIEENEHNISGHGDETREFQNHLFALYYDELTAEKS